MKLTAIILLSACLAASAKGKSQGITLSVKDAPLEKVFIEIKKQTGYSFVYYKDDLAKGQKVTIQVSNARIEEVLNLLFKDKPITYSIFEHNIVLKQKTESPNEQTTDEPKPIPITGKVFDENGNPLVGATVTVRGTQTAVKTDANGQFTIEANAGQTLVITYVGYVDEQIKVGNETTLTVTLEVDVKSLLAVTVNKGYYTEKMRNTVGNVATVKAADIEKQPVSNPLLALQGRVPGLVITQSSGVPGSGVTVRIQGRNSINGGNDPLYIIDGVPYPSQMLATTTGGNNFTGILGTSGGSNLAPGGNGNPLSFIGVENIESIEILKDADATSIYGSRGANGVILITTKKGSVKGKNKIELNFQQGWGKVTRTIEMMNTRQYLDMRYEALRNDGININSISNSTSFRYYDLNVWDTTRYTDWQKVLTGGTAHYTDANGSVSGGNANLNYRIGGGYHRETTVFPGNFNNKRGVVNFIINNQSLDRRFSLQLSASYINNNNALPQADFISTALQLPPTAPPIYNGDGSLNWAPNSIDRSSWTNPLSQLNNKYENTTENLISSFIVGYKITPDLELKTQLGYNRLQTDEFSGLSILSRTPESRATFNRTAQYTSSTIKFYLAEPQLNYTRTFGKVKIDVLLGTTIQQNQNKGEVINTSGHPTDDLLRDIRSATSFNIPSSIDAVYKYNALFSRINLNWSNKYILNLTGRRDGSSRFGPENRFQNFGSIGGAWIFTEENLFKKQSILSFGKLRASYGTTGNDQIGDYTYLDLYNSVSNPVPYQNWSSISIDNISNPYLQWEETRKLSVGFSLGLINDRILADITFNRNRSSNQLISYSLPYTTGFTSVYLNLPATIQNISWEFSLNSMNVKQKSFTWETNFNLTVPKNKLVSFPSIEQTTLAGSLVIGQPLSITKAFHYLGVDPVTGLYQFLDQNGNPTTSPTFNDRTVLVNTDPKLYGGFQNSFRFKRVEISTFFQFTKQKQSTLSLLKFGYANPPGSASLNQPAFVLDRWQKLGDDAEIQKYSTAFSAYFPWSNASQSDAGIVDASFIRLKNITASYDLKTDFLKKSHIEKLRLFVEGQNLLTISKFKGIDPENQSSSSLPPLRVLAVGLNVQF